MLIVNSSIPWWLHVGTRGHWKWALVVTSSGIGDTGILATYIGTGRHDHGASCDESPAAAGSSIASAATTAGRYGRVAGKPSSERKCFASSVGRLVGPVEPEHGRGRIGSGT